PHTGDPPVRSGDSPDGMGVMDRADGDGLFPRLLSTVPVGGSPTGAGESPASRPRYLFSKHALSIAQAWFSLRAVSRIGSGAFGPACPRSLAGEERRRP